MKRKNTLKQVFRYLRPYRGRVILSLLCALFCVALTLAVPILIGRAIDQMVGAGQVLFDRILKIVVWILAAVVGTAALQWFSGRFNNKVTYGVVHDMRRDCFAKLSRLPLNYLDSHPAGETVSRIITDADTFADGLLMGFTQLFSGVATILGTLTVMLVLNYKIALAVLLITPLSLFVASFIAKRTYSMFHVQSEIRGEQTALIDEMIGEQKVVQAFSYQTAAQKRFDVVNERLRVTSLKAIFYSSLVNPSTRFVNAAVYTAVGLVGAFSVISGGMTVGLFSGFLSYANQFTKPFNEISGVVTELQNALACGGRIFELLDETEETPDVREDASLPLRGDVAARHVYFSYREGQRLIEDLNLSVEAGQQIAIVGPTGCGKTTLINLLMRFYDPVSGSVCADGIDLRNLSRTRLRRNFGMVLQDTWLKAGTVRENIVMGKPDATEEEILAAAKASRAHGFITRLSQGYDTVLGENGEGLSQGQKQLLCITRVMLCLPPMLILDEATSSIDTRTEALIQQAFSRMMKGRTSFVVAHRLSTIRESDRILVMKSGNVIEQGTHGQLLAQNGFYARLYRSQFAR